MSIVHGDSFVGAVPRVTKVKMARCAPHVLETRNLALILLVPRLPIANHDALCLHRGFVAGIAVGGQWLSYSSNSAARADGRAAPNHASRDVQDRLAALHHRAA